jgi:hypothetical protein
VNPFLRDEIASIIAEAVQAPPVPADVDFDALDVSPRAQKLRAAIRIANRHGWHSAIVMFLESRGKSHIGDLSDPQLDDLLDRMNGYVDAAEMGCSLADCLSAS